MRREEGGGRREKGEGRKRKRREGARGRKGQRATLLAGQPVLAVTGLIGPGRPD
jgi:hypothetical protein